MTWEERTRYQASWGAWYVQIQFGTGEMVELKFDHSPTAQEIDPIAQTVWQSLQEPEPTVEERITDLERRVSALEGDHD